MQTLIDELMNETKQTASCADGSCNCPDCRHRRNQSVQQIQRELESLELNLEEEEELELSRLFARAKDLLKKGYNKVKPIVPILDVVRKVAFPDIPLPYQNPAPPQASVRTRPGSCGKPKVNRQIPEKYRRRVQRRPNPPGCKPPRVQQLQKENSLIQELFMENGF